MFTLHALRIKKIKKKKKKAKTQDIVFVNWTHTKKDKFTIYLWQKLVLQFKLSSPLKLGSYLPIGAEKRGSYLPDHFRHVFRSLEKTF